MGGNVPSRAAGLAVSYDPDTGKFTESLKL